MLRDRVIGGREHLRERGGVPVDTAALRLEELQAGAQRAAKVAGVHPAVDARCEGVRVDETGEVPPLSDLLAQVCREVVGAAG